MTHSDLGLDRPVVRCHPWTADDIPFELFSETGVARLVDRLAALVERRDVRSVMIEIIPSLAGTDVATRLRLASLGALAAALVHLAALTVSRPAADFHQYVPTGLAALAAATGLVSSDWLLAIWREWHGGIR